MTYFVKSFGWYSTAEELFISLEYFPLGDLQTYLSSTSRVSDDDAREITRQVLCGLNFMHNEGFAHRDLKPAVSPTMNAEFIHKSLTLSRTS